MKGGEIMKKIILLLVVVTAIAFAAELDTWWDNSGSWVLQTGTKARCRTAVSGTAISGLDTTMKVNPIALQTKADVGQWITYSLSGGDVITHYVRKPGTFAGKAQVLTYTSNGIVAVTFTGFEDLTKGSDNIAISYAIDSINGTGAWADPSAAGVWKNVTQLNAYTASGSIGVEDSLKFWQKIVVPNMGRPGLYQDADGATITLTLSEQATWIQTNGNFATNLP